jgi:superfamily II DNA/RNA helicase
MAEVKQLRLLGMRPEIVVGTPGRLWELMARGDIQGIGRIGWVIIDEADR